jgi:hypothetical protein
MNNYNEEFKKKCDEEIANPHWNCRFHPTDGRHEHGCPHQEWTKEQLQKALILAKASNVALALCQNKELLSQLQLLQEMEKGTFQELVDWWLHRPMTDNLDYLTTPLLTVIKLYLESRGK